MNAKRLLKLAKLLDKVPKKRFDYKFLVGNDWQGDPDLSCGTTACALSWATTIPEFRRAGLRLEMGFGSGYIRLYNRATKDCVDGPFSAGAAFFDIDADESVYLFAPRDDTERGATAKQVAKKIRQFVALKRKVETAEAGMIKAQAAYDDVMNQLADLVPR